MSRNTRLTELDVLRIHFMARNGVPTIDIAAVFNVHRATITQITRGDSWRWLADVTDRDIAKRLYKETNKTCREIAAELRSSYYRVWCLIHDKRVKARPVTLLEKCRSGRGNFDPTRLPKPVKILPGSHKVPILAERVANGQALWHPEDGPEHELD